MKKIKEQSGLARSTITSSYLSSCDLTLQWKADVSQNASILNALINIVLAFNAIFLESFRILCFDLFVPSIWFSAIGPFALYHKLELASV